MPGSSALRDKENGSNDADDTENIMKIMVASDIHLGFLEKDAIRGEDSFRAFEEILQLSIEHEVDFILLGGDLFHDGKPTVSSINKCMELLRHYCMGERPLSLEFFSDQSENFQHCANPTVNYMDPNLNVAYPVFSIHGNHDDPLGYNGKCSLDMLSAAGLVNYFGRHTDMSNIALSPLLLKKGTTKLALYGLGAIRDKMLHRLFRQNKVSMLRPDADPEEWFNLMVLHQNRVPHKLDEYVPEKFLPSFMDLIIWGHEHENRLKPEFNEERGFYVSQPGSPVATSLSEGESVRKQVGLLTVRARQFHVRRISLKTVRPFVFRTINLARDFTPSATAAKRVTQKEEVQVFLENQVEDMLKLALDQLTGHPKQPTQPLIRLRVEHRSELEMFSLVRFGLQFSGKVANPTDLIKLKNVSQRNAAGLKRGDVLDQEALDIAASTAGLHTVEQFVEKYFSECDNDKQMKVLTVRGVNEAMGVFLRKNDPRALEDLIEYQCKKTEKYLLDKEVEEDDLDQEIEELRERRLQQPDQETQEVLTMLQNNNDRLRLREGMEGEEVAAPAAGRGRGRGRARAAPRGRGRGAAPPVDDDMLGIDDDNDNMDFSPPPTRGRGSRGGRAARGAAAGTPRGRGRAAAKAALNVTTSQASSSAKPQRKALGRMAFVDSDSD